MGGSRCGYTKLTINHENDNELKQKIEATIFRFEGVNTLINLDFGHQLSC